MEDTRNENKKMTEMMASVGCYDVQKVVARGCEYMAALRMDKRPCPLRGLQIDLTVGGKIGYVEETADRPWTVYFRTKAIVREFVMNDEGACFRVAIVGDKRYRSVTIKSVYSKLSIEDFDWLKTELGAESYIYKSTTGSLVFKNVKGEITFNIDLGNRSGSLEYTRPV